MRSFLRVIVFLSAVAFLSPFAAPQSSTAAIDLVAHITPTGARPEPVRQFSFYVLTKSFVEITKEVDSQDPLPTREQFIDKLKISPELKSWIKAHEIMDLTSPDLDTLVTPDEIMNVPEFLAAYQRTNSGGVTYGLPSPKFHEVDKTAQPEKYEKLQQEYFAAMKKFIQSHPATTQGMELELAGVNPKYQWDKLQADHRKRVAQLGPDVAQTKYLAAKTDTDLDGRALISSLPPGNYWISSLGMNAASGDRRIHWDVPVKLQPGQTLRIELNNVNGTDANASQP
jgi:hypothetical protein